MSTRRFEAATTPAALHAVRVAFGEDAFILSNRRTERGVEIIASRFDVTDTLVDGPADDPAEPVHAANTGEEHRPGEGAPRTTRISIESLAAMPPASASGERPTDVHAPDVEGTDADEAPAGRTGAVTEEHGVDAASAPGSVPAPAAIDMTALDEAVRCAVGASLKELLPALSMPSSEETMEIAVATAASLNRTAEARLQRIEVALWGKEDKQRAHLLDRMLRLGLGASTAVRLSEQSCGEDIKSLMRDALARLRNSLPILRNAGTGAQGVLGVKLLSGPDSDARLVSMLQFARAAIALEGSRSVVLVSADTGRIGAFPLLEECARELGCVAVRVRHADDLEATLLSLSDRACVLVDAGNAWPDSASPHQRLLVLPATLQRGACAALIETARRGRADGCVLRSLQAAGRPGESLEALIEHWLPIAFWSDSDEPDTVPRRAEAASIVAAAIDAARRLGSNEHDRLLGALIHPGRNNRGAGFGNAVRIPCGAERRGGRPPGEPLGESLGGVPMKALTYMPPVAAGMPATASARSDGHSIRMPEHVGKAGPSTTVSIGRLVL